MNHAITRRKFLKSTAAAAGLVAGFPYIVNSSVLGADGAVAPSNRLVMGALGVGGMGSGNMRNFLGRKNVQMIAVCDVDAGHRDRAKATIDKGYGNADSKTYEDFREMLAKHKFDAVTIAVPDHWHALLAVSALRAGCDVYGEKPLARSIREGRAICNAVAKYSRVWQTGSQQRSDSRFRFASELVRNGRIGKIHRVEVGLPTGKGAKEGKDFEFTAPPPELNYEMWLGPAPTAPYCKSRIHWNWRWIRDYSGGQMTDWMGHHIDISLWGLGMDQSPMGPLQVVPHSVSYPPDGLWDAMTDYHFTCKMPGGVEMDVSNKNTMGAKWIGEKGWVWVTRGRMDAEPKSLLKEVIGPGEIHLYNSPEHHTNFLECVRTRQEPIAPARVAQRAITCGLLGEIALLVNRTITWDAEKEEIIGDPEASRLLGRSYREPWHL